MEGIGIVRRIDNLGRIVIPMEIRRNLKFKEGDPLELYVSGNNIIVKKFSAIDSFGEDLFAYCDEISKALNMTVLVTDVDKVLAGSGKGKTIYNGKPLEKEFKQSISQRKEFHSKLKESHIPIFLQDTLQYREQVVVPIISKGEVVGSLVGVSDNTIDKTSQEFLEIFSKLFTRLLE